MLMMLEAAGVAEACLPDPVFAFRTADTVTLKSGAVRLIHSTRMSWGSSELSL